MKTVPMEIIEAARMDGAGPFRIFWNIVMPLIRPILITVGVALETMKQIDSQLMMRNYEGFLR